MLQREQVLLEEWLSLAKSLFWYETNFGWEHMVGRFSLKSLNIGDVCGTQSKISDDFQHLTIFTNKLYQICLTRF